LIEDVAMGQIICPIATSSINERTPPPQIPRSTERISGFLCLVLKKLINAADTTCLSGLFHILVTLSEIGLDWARFNVHSTHFGSFRGLWGNCGISQDCSRSQSPQCVRYWVVCVRPLLITVVCMCIIWKALCPYVLDARYRTVGFSGTRLYLCIYNQPSWATLKHYPPPG